MMKEAFVYAVLALVASASLGGCAHYPANAPKTGERAGGYYYQDHKRQNNSEDILLLLAFSGGGTRAASFSYGVLETLRDVTFDVDGKPRRLLDEVDVISSVSGGSITAAAYGLYGDRTFEILEPAFLKHDVELALTGQVLNPLNWPALWSSNYSRSDLTAKYFDEILFKNARFQDLAGNNSPYLVINATDIATGTRVSFTQYFFDVISSDLDSYPLSRAATASAAVPGVFSPITLDNYSGRDLKSAPDWVTRKYGPDAGAAKQQATALEAYLNGTNPFLHLVDGGVSDNLGLRVYLETFAALGSSPELLGDPLSGKVRKVIFISVDAHVHAAQGWDRKSPTPDTIPVVMAAEARMVENYSTDTLEWFQRAIDELRNRPALKGKVEFYAIDLSFKQFDDPAQELYFRSLPTNFSLDAKVVDQLKAAARTLLHQNPAFKKLMTDLGARSAPTGNEATVPAR